MDKYKFSRYMSRRSEIVGQPLTSSWTATNRPAGSGLRGFVWVAAGSGADTRGGRPVSFV